MTNEHPFNASKILIGALAAKQEIINEHAVEIQHLKNLLQDASELEEGYRLSIGQRDKELNTLKESLTSIKLTNFNEKQAIFKDIEKFFYINDCLMKRVNLAEIKKKYLGDGEQA
jgi:hypothetical protein